MADHVRQQLERCRKFLALFAGPLGEQQRLPGCWAPYHPAHEHRYDRGIRYHAEENADTVRPGLQRFNRTLVHGRIRLDAAGRKSQHRAAVAQMCADVPNEVASGRGIIADVEQAVAGVRERVQKGPIPGDDLQVFAIQRCAQAKCVCHTRMIRQRQERAARQGLVADDLHFVYVVTLGTARRLGEAVTGNAGIELEHLVRKAPGGLLQQAAEHRPPRPVVPAERRYQVVQHDLSERFWARHRTD